MTRDEFLNGAEFRFIGEGPTDMYKYSLTGHCVVKLDPANLGWHYCCNVDAADATTAIFTGAFCGAMVVQPVKWEDLIAIGIGMGVNTAPNTTT